MITSVKIHDLSKDEDNISYIAKNESDCRDFVDLDVFKLVREHGNIITMGCVIGEPVFS